MKKIPVLIAFLFCAVISFAQFPNSQSISNASTLYHIKGGVIGDLSVLIPNIDTLNNIATPYQGALTVRPQDGLLWMSDGVNWHRFVTSSGAGVFLDTIYTQLPIFVRVDSSFSPPHRIITLLHANGLLSGGVVTQGTNCFTLDVTASVIILQYKQYSAAQDTGIVIAAADPTFGRIDRVVTDSNLNVIVITGTPSATPVPPPYNTFSQVELTQITIPAGATCLSVTQDIIYDQNTGSPEWTISTSGTISQNPNNTDKPYHLTKADYIVTYTDGSQLIFTKPSGTDTVKASSVFKGFIYLLGAFTNQISAQWYNGSTAVSNSILLNPYFNVNDSNQYQIFAPPLSAWSWPGGSAFNKLVLTFGGNDVSGAKGLYLDYLQIQTGINNVATTLQLTTVGSSGAATLIGNVLNIPIYSGGGTLSDTTFQWSVLDSLSTPAVFIPGQFVEGNKYLVGTSPTGLFVGHANNIATYDSTAATYTFDTATIGDLLYNATTDFVSKWTGVTWVRVGRATLHQGGDTYGVPIVMGSRDNVPTTFLVNNGLAGSIGIAGSYNLSLGILSLPASSTGDRNTAIGSAALALNTTGFHNTALGYATNYHNIIGNQNTAVGWAAVGWNRGTGNTAVGYSALNSTVSVVRDATYNTAIGWEALQNNGDHFYNIGLGVQAGQLDAVTLAPVARDSTLYVSNFTKNMYFKLDSVGGTAPYTIGMDANKFWHVYSGSGGGSSLANFYLKDSTFSSNRVAALNGNTLDFKQGDSSLLSFDPVNFFTSLQATDELGQSKLTLVGDMFNGNGVNFSLSSNVGGVAQVSINGSATNHTLDFTALNQTFNGEMDYNGNAKLLLDRVENLNGHFLQIQDAAAHVLLNIDETTGNTGLYTFNSTGGDNTTQMSLFSDATSSSFVIDANFNGDTKRAYVNGFSDASTSTLTYTADTSIFNGIITYNTPPNGTSTDSVLTRDAATGIVKMRNSSAFVTTADNGLTVNTGNNVQLGGTLLQNTTVDAGTSALIFQQTSGTANMVQFLTSGTSTGRPLIVVSNSSATALTTSNTAGGIPLETNSEGIATAYLRESDASTNTVLPIVLIERNVTGGNGANGIGSEIQFSSEKSTGVPGITNNIISKYTDATAFTSEFSIEGVNSAATQILLTLSGNGEVIINNGALRLKGYTVATLPAGVQGDLAFVTDALAPAYHVTVVGGGAVIVPVFYNGTNWIVN